MSFVNRMYALEQQKKRKEEKRQNWGNEFGLWGQKKTFQSNKKPVTSWKAK